MHFKMEDFIDANLLKEAKDRFTFSCMDMLTYFTEKENVAKYENVFGAILGDLPYGNQYGNHVQDPEISQETDTKCAHGMMTMAADNCAAVLGCGTTDQVLFSSKPSCFLFCRLFARGVQKDAWFFVCHKFANI